MASRPVSPATADSAPGSGDQRSLVLRVWLETGEAPRLRARIVEIVPGLGERPVAVTTSVDEVSRVVRNWLEEFQADSPSGNRDGTVTPRG
jgi:hypothetical protein